MTITRGENIDAAGLVRARAGFVLAVTSNR
jgi:hypothetical protein